MTVERMLTRKSRSAELVGRVLQEAGIEYVFGISGGHTGRIVSGPAQVPELRPHGAGARGIARGRDGRGLRPADPPSWRNDRPGTLGARQRADRHHRGVPVAARPCCCSPTSATRHRFHLHAPYQQATGDYGSWDARRAFSGVTKQVMQAHEPIAAVQATQLAIKHALAGQPGPVAVLFRSDALAGTVSPDSQPGLYPTRHYLPPPPRRPMRRASAAAAEALLAAQRPVIIAGNGVRIAQAYDQLRLAEPPGCRWRRPLPARAASPRRTAWRSACSAPSARRPPTRASPRRTLCWRWARSSGPATRPGRTATCSTHPPDLHPDRHRAAQRVLDLPGRACAAGRCGVRAGAAAHGGPPHATGR